MSRGRVIADVKEAARAVAASQALVFTAGAGMGVDSGLADFRGPEGLWRAYPPLAERGLTLPETSTPEWFHRDPRFAWGFFGHRYNLYKRTTPHEGFQILRKWARDKDHFIFTSNVDGHFQKAGFSEANVVECHGSINFMQCVDKQNCDRIWPVPEDMAVKVDEEKLLAELPLPTGPPGDTHPARPNILMFGDWGWADERTSQQEDRFSAFVTRLKQKPFVVVEIGAGLAVPTVRFTSERLVERKNNGFLVRINPREPEIPSGAVRGVSLQLGGLEALKLIDAEMDHS